MERNRLKQRLREGRVATICHGCDSPDMVDFIGSLGHLDAVWVEMEHGPATWSDLGDLSRAADLWGMSSVVRVRANDPELIGLTLSLGVDGIIVPHVKSREEAERVVDAALFSPVGHRGASVPRKSYGRPDYFTEANDETFIMVLIEDVVGVENLSEILKVPHIDVFYVTKSDLSLSMGLPPPNDFFPGVHSVDTHVLDVRDRVIEQIVAAGRVAGTNMAETPGDFEKYIEMGVRFSLVSLQHWVTEGAKSFVDKLRAAEGEVLTTR